MMSAFEISLKELFILKQASQSSETIFLQPSVLHKYEDIISGPQIRTFDLSKLSNFMDNGNN